MTSAAKLNSETAVLTTASIEVKVMKLNKRQVTLSVFRQLQAESLFDLSARKAVGIAWGTVNYHPDKSCRDLGEHVHTVWERSRELRRWCMASDFRDSYEHQPYAKALDDVWSGITFGAITRELIRIRSGEETFVSRYKDRVVDFCGLDVCVTTRRWPLVNSYEYMDDLDGFLRKHHISPETTSEQIEQRAEGHLSAYHDSRTEIDRIAEAWKDLYSQIVSLDQIFIAV